MPVQSPKSLSQIQASLLTNLASTGIRQLAAGGKARGFADAFASELSAQEVIAFGNLAQTQLPFATGTSLDLLGEQYGVYRLPELAAESPLTDNNFRFFVRSGTFGDINNGQDISIPAGVQIYTASPNGPSYISSAAILPAGEKSAYFSASSLSSGSVGNAPNNVFTRHNFSGYTDYRFGSLLVTNDYGIVGGRDPEGDESFRFRIHLKLQAVSGANEDAIRSALLVVPGIQDVVFSPYAGGFQVYVYGISTKISRGLLDNVQSVLNQTVAYPVTALAVAPDLVGISLSTSIQFTGAPSSTEKDIVLSRAVAAARNYIDNLGTSSPLVINEIADVIRSTGGILDIGSPNQPIAEIFVWRSRTDGTRYSRYLVNNLQPVKGERIVVEDRVNAINLVAA